MRGRSHDQASVVSSNVIHMTGVSSENNFCAMIDVFVGTGKQVQHSLLADTGNNCLIIPSAEGIADQDSNGQYHPKAPYIIIAQNAHNPWDNQDPNVGPVQRSLKMSGPVTLGSQTFDAEFYVAVDRRNYNMGLSPIISPPS